MRACDKLLSCHKTSQGPVTLARPRNGNRSVKSVSFILAPIQSLLRKYSDDQQHFHYIREALSQAAKCVPTPTAFCVGCLLVARYPSITDSPVVLAAGYSRELHGNTHAEANALANARSLAIEELSHMFPSAAGQKPINIDDVLMHTDVYTTLEPCSVRTSGLAPCADALVAARVPRCFIGVGEPDDFVQCEGAQKLKAAGCQVIWLKGLEDDCLAAARRGHN